ncbi:MAG TPA: hypothetical protein VGP46_04640, partial [Acidimicrobiales bacterium]|nr:hypothetical protein [Acidimicrobiales bacterium]
SLTAGERCVLDAVSARTARSISLLIREAIDGMYGARSAEDDVEAMKQAFGARSCHLESGKETVDARRTGARLSHARPLLAPYTQQ